MSRVDYYVFAWVMAKHLLGFCLSLILANNITFRFIFLKNKIIISFFGQNFNIKVSKN